MLNLLAQPLKPQQGIVIAYVICNLQQNQLKLLCALKKR
jgi:hypothetical protein